MVTLLEFFLISVGLAATLLSVALLCLLIVGLVVAVRVKRLFDRVERVSTEVAEFVRTSTVRLSALERFFLTTQGLRQVAGYVAHAFHSYNKKKGDTYGKE